jgi:hypothetical protein
MTPAEEFGQLRLKFTDPVQHHYEVIRPIVLFSETISARSRQTGVERTHHPHHGRSSHNSGPSP